MSAVRSVLMVATSAHRRVGGVERHVEAVRRELEARGVATAVTALGPTRALPLAIPRLARTIARLSPDVVHTHDYVPTLAAALALRAVRRAAPLYATVHGYEGWPLRPHHVLGHRLAARAARRSIAVGAYVDAFYGTRSALVTHGGVEAVGAVAEPPAPAVSFVARYAADTDAPDVVRALRILAETRGVAARTYGFGPLEQTLRELAGGAVRVGGVTDDPRGVAAASTVVVATSYLAVLEAFSVGRPVVAVARNALKRAYLEEIAAASGALRVATGADALAAHVAALLDDDAARRAAADAALAYAARFTWARVASDYLGLWAVR